MSRKPQPYTVAWHLDRRDRAMAQARSGRGFAANRPTDPGCIAQMRVWVQGARRNNHYALAVRRQEVRG